MVMAMAYVLIVAHSVSGCRQHAAARRVRQASRAALEPRPAKSKAFARSTRMPPFVGSE
jgi:hypothetical protein